MTLTGEQVEVPADARAFHELSLANGWGDGAPLLPPTDAAIEALLACSPDAGEHVLGVLPPEYGVATVELIATNAAMAGVQPEAFPLVLAALEALTTPEWNAFGLTTTTSSVFPMLIVNGPCRVPLGIDHRAGCMGGAGGRGSMTIGRAVALCLRNIGGQRAGETSRSVFGQPARFGQCFAEWEERSPWPSLAVRRGFAAEQEIVTVHGSKGNFPMADINNDSAEDLTYTIAKTIAFPLNNWYLEPTGESGQLVLCINPMWAERFGKVFPNVEDWQQYLWENAWQPISLFRPTNAEVLEAKGRVDDQGRVFLCSRPDQLVPVVCGGLGSLHAQALTSFCESDMQSVATER